MLLYYNVLIQLQLWKKYITGDPAVIHLRLRSSVDIEKIKTNVAEPGKNVAKIGQTFNVSSLGVQ